MSVASSKVSIYGQHHREPCAGCTMWCAYHCSDDEDVSNGLCHPSKKRKNIRRRRKPSPFIVIIVKWLVVLACVRYKPREWSMKKSCGLHSREKKDKKMKRIGESHSLARTRDWNMEMRWDTTANGSNNIKRQKMTSSLLSKFFLIRPRQYQLETITWKRKRIPTPDLNRTIRN